MTRARRHQQNSDVTPRTEREDLASGDRFLILTEGEQTEKRYFDDLCGKLNFSAYHVEIQSPDSDPLNLVEKAIEFRDENRSSPEQTRADYDQVWVVCDREEKTHHRIPRLQEACVLARRESIHLAISIPAFELWLMLHHHYSPASLADYSAVEKKLTELQETDGRPAYGKAVFPLDFYLTKERVAIACRHAEKLRDYHEGNNPAGVNKYWAKDYILQPGGAQNSDGNPGTDVDQLVIQLNLAANPAFRFIPWSGLQNAPFTR